MDQILAYIAAHPLLLSSLGGLIVALLDFAFALNDDLKSNGILHFLYLQGQKLLGQKPPAPPAA